MGAEFAWSPVSTCLSAIRKSFYGVSWLLTKHGSITTRQKWKNSQNSGLHPTNVLQRRWKQFHLMERSWPPFFLEFARYYAQRPFEEEKDNHRAVLCWFFGPIRGWLDEKNGPIWRRKKCSFTMTTHQLIHPQLPQQNLSNCATNCCLIHPILQIWSHAISFCSQAWKKWLNGKRFMSNEEVIAATEAYFAQFDKPYYLDGLKKLEYRWTKCIELKGVYIET